MFMDKHTFWSYVIKVTKPKTEVSLQSYQPDQNKIKVQEQN